MNTFSFFITLDYNPTQPPSDNWQTGPTCQAASQSNCDAHRWPVTTNPLAEADSCGARAPQAAPLLHSRAAPLIKTPRPVWPRCKFRAVKRSERKKNFLKTKQKKKKSSRHRASERAAARRPPTTTAGAGARRRWRWSPSTRRCGARRRRRRRWTRTRTTSSPTAPRSPSSAASPRPTPPTPSPSLPTPSPSRYTCSSQLRLSARPRWVAYAAYFRVLLEIATATTCALPLLCSSD